MKVRLAEPAEAEACWEIRNKAIRYGCQRSYDADVIAAWTPESMPEGYRRAISANPFFVVVDLDNRPVTTGFLDISCGSVEAVFTLPEYVGRGLAGLILDAIKHEARDRGYEQLTLSSTPNAQAFYQKHGFLIKQESVYQSSLVQGGLRCIDMVLNL